jgi:hypothetical protein
MTSKFKESKKFNVFLCLPMSGRTEEDILKEIDEMKNASIHYFHDKHPGCEIVYYANYRSDAEEESDNPVYLLGRGIMNLMSQADVCLFSKNWKDSKGCKIEHDVAKTYHIDILDIGNDSCLTNRAAFYHLGFKPKSIYRMESPINFDETDVTKDCEDKVTRERRKRIVECIKTRTLLFPLGVLDRTATDDGYVIGLQPIECLGTVGTMTMHVNSSDVDELKISFKEVFDLASIEEESNED